MSNRFLKEEDQEEIHLAVSLKNMIGLLDRYKQRARTQGDVPCILLRITNEGHFTQGPISPCKDENLMLTISILVHYYTFEISQVFKYKEKWKSQTRHPNIPFQQSQFLYQREQTACCISLQLFVIMPEFLAAQT